MDSYYVDLMLLFLYPSVFVGILYKLNKRYSYKIKLIKLFGSTFKYKIFLLIIMCIIFGSFTYFLGTRILVNPFYITIQFSYFYLISIPKELA